MVDICIDEVIPKGESYPLIAHFQNGYPTESFTDQECAIFEHKVNGKKVVATEINNILYTGEECVEDLGQTFLLARNRTTGKVRIIEVGNVELQPMMLSKVEEPEVETSYVELGRKFGSKRHKKILEQNEKLKVNEEVVMEQLKDVSQNVSVDQLDLSSYNKTDVGEFYLPPINREAVNLEDVYMISAILTEEEYEAIFAEIDSTEYRTNLFPYIKQIFSEKWSKEQTVLAVYASSVLNMIIKTMKDMKVKSFVACPFSETLNNIILKNFFTYSGTSRGRPLQYRDKCICYSIVLLYLINNYKVDIEAFCRHTKLVEKTACTKVVMTGGYVSRQGGKKIAVLKLPLNKASAGFAKKRRQ